MLFHVEQWGSVQPFVRRKDRFSTPIERGSFSNNRERGSFSAFAKATKSAKSTLIKTKNEEINFPFKNFETMSGSFEKF